MLAYFRNESAQIKFHEDRSAPLSDEDLDRIVQLEQSLQEDLGGDRLARIQ